MKLKFILHRIIKSTNNEIRYYWKQTLNPSEFGYTDDELHMHSDPPPGGDIVHCQGWVNYILKKL